MSKVFISYRREDAAGFAQAIFGQLERHLRRDQIFMDVDTVEPGVDFVNRIEEAIGESDVVIALIGKRWMGEREGSTANTRPARYCSPGNCDGFGAGHQSYPHTRRRCEYAK